MSQYLIMFHSLTYAQRASTVLERAGITASIARAPLGLSQSGCGYCVKVSEKKFHAAMKAITASELPHGRIFHQSDKDEYTEVGE